ncbi:MAG: hypothetical protein ACKN9T_18775 [Candidatus Methylumidiphilus sp.]
MWNFNLLAATRTVEAAMPFLLYRMAVCLGLAVASLLAALAGAGTLIAFASFSSKPGSVGGLGALLGLAGLVYVLRRFRGPLFFNIEAGHLALLAELAKTGKLPQGKAQLDLARQRAAEVFPAASGFVELDGEVKEVLRDLTGRHCPVLGKITNKALADQFLWVAGRVAQTSAPALLSLCFVAEAGHAWGAARAGLILHQRHFDLLSKNRQFLLAFEVLGLVTGYLAMLYPVDSAAAMLPVDIGVWRTVFALIFAWSLKASFVDPIATTALAGLYFDLAKQEPADSAAEAQQLAAHSAAFRRIAEKAARG